MCVYIYIYTFFLMIFSIMIYHRIFNIVLVLYNRPLMFIHFAYSSLPLMIPNSQSIPPPHAFPFSNHKFVL